MMKIPTVMFSPENTIEVGFEFRLRPGDVVDFEGEKIVVAVDSCRAKLCGSAKKAVAFTDSRTGNVIAFDTLKSEITSVSPNSLLPVKRRLGAAGLEYWRQNKILPA
jgi:hypothetical protein